MNGAALKGEALAFHEQRHEDLLLRARRALLAALLEKECGSADDVRERLDLPPGVNPACLGSVPGPLVKAGIIEKGGFVPSTRPETHARPVSVWRLVNRDRALDWLEAHPEPLDHGPVQGELFPQEKAGAATPAITRDSRHAQRLLW